MHKILKMNKTQFFVSLLAAVTISACNSSSSSSNEEVELIDQIDSVSYALGLLTSENYNTQIGGDLDADLIAEGIKDNYVGGDTNAQPMIPLEEAEFIIQKYAFEKTQAKSQGNLDEGLAYLEANKTKEGVVTLPSGLQYKVVKEGEGPQPSIDDKVVCHYTGTFIDGRVFDSSVERGEPATFQVKGVIKGWQEAIPMMKVGSKWELYIPPSLAYGAKDNPGMPANSTLVFEVELLDIVKE